MATMTMRAETPREYQQSVIEVSEDSINSIEKVEEWKVNGNHSNGNLPRMPNGASPRENGKIYFDSTSNILGVQNVDRDGNYLNCC